MKKSPLLSTNRLCLLAALWISATASHGFWSLFRSVNDSGTWLFAISLAISTTALIAFLLRLLSPGRSVRVMLSLLLLVTAITSWFIDTYGLGVDREMLRNVVQTNPAEARVFFGAPLLWRLVWQALLPIWLLWSVPLAATDWLRSARDYLLGLVISMALLLAVALPMYVSYASFFRNQQKAFTLMVPANVVWASFKLARKSWHANTPFVTVGADAKRSLSSNRRPLLTLLVVGETARAANFSLGDYPRPTNPLLRERQVFYFSQVHSCGTATAFSVPCMFSDLPRGEFDLGLAEYRGNVLDILHTAGLSITWIDNQSGCKDVCTRVPTEQADHYDPTACMGGECLDQTLLRVLEAKLPLINKDTVLIMHSMGSHGPSYYQRVPPDRLQFKPVCATKRIETCTQQEIINTYDNSIAYTDYILASLIDQLQRRQDKIDAVLVYVSDHGESLGENGLYLHGEPYSIAPDFQTHVPMLMWFSKDTPARLGLDETCLRIQRATHYSHDNLSHTLLGLNDVTTSAYRPQLDMLRGCRVHGDL